MAWARRPLRRPHRPLGEAQRRRHATTSNPAERRPGRCSATCSRSTAARPAPTRRRGPRRVRQEDPAMLDEWARVRHRAQAEDIRDLFVPQLLLRLRGRRPADGDRVQHQGQPVRRTAPGDVRLRHLALGRARHGRRARGGVRDGRARADHRRRLPRLHVHQPRALLHRARTRRSSPAPRSRPTSTRSCAGTAPEA